jgi:hypothetical protein
MSRSNWVVLTVALGMIAATAGWLQDLRGRHLLGPAGVRVGAVPIYDEKRQVAATQSIVLPANVPGMLSRALPITRVELDTLPKDTTFGRRLYESDRQDFATQVTVVLMGTDHTSIHQPQYCLYAQGWNITSTERITLPMARPFCDIPAIKMLGTRQNNDGQMESCLYVYWFVSGDNITAEEGSRLWSMWKSVLKTGQMERWAYISYFAPCLPGREQATFERLAKFIQASVPEFQLVTGKPAGPPAAMTARQ